MLRRWQICARHLAICSVHTPSEAGCRAVLTADQAGAAVALQVSAEADGRSSRWLPWLLSATAAAALQLLHPAYAQADQGLAPESTPGWSLLDIDTRRRAFFKYEKRIRDFSPPDKVFEYFATTEVNGVRMMRPENLLCSLVAVFPPEHSIAVRTGSLPGEPSAPPDHVKAAAQDSLFTRLFDMDNDGAISYFEYLLLVTFLSIPPADVAIAFQMFDMDDSGTIDLPEFRKVTDGLRSRMGKAAHLSHFKRPGFSSQGEEGSSGIVRAFFGPDGKHNLDLAKFALFLTALHDEVVRLEFCHYAKSNEGKMSGRDFARTLVSGVQSSMIDTYLNRISNLPDSLADTQLSLAQFRHFAELRKDMHSLTVALNFFHNTVGQLDRAAFTRASKNITGAPLDKPIVDLLYAVFDLDGNDDLSPGEVIEVLRQREGNSTYKFEQAHRPSLFTCLIGCIAGDKMES